MDKKIQERENENFEQKHDTLLAEEMIYPQVKEELKNRVDELIEIELENLRLLYVSKKKKPKKAKKPKKPKIRKKKFPGNQFNAGKDIT